VVQSHSASAHYRDQKIEMWENAINHYCSDHSKGDRPAHQGHQSKNRDMPEAQASLRGYLAEGSKIIQKIDLLSGPTQTNGSFHAVRGKYTEKRLGFTTSNEACFALGVRCLPVREPRLARRAARILGHPPLQAQCSKMLHDPELKREQKMRKEDKNLKE
jgi:hypothetical protein